MISERRINQRRSRVIILRYYLVIDDPRHGRPGGHGDGEEAEQGADGLAGALGPAQVEGYGPDQGDEAAVEEAHDGADEEQHLVLVLPGVLGRDHQHGAHAHAEERELDREGEVRCWLNYKIWIFRPVEGQFCCRFC